MCSQRSARDRNSRVHDVMSGSQCATQRSAKDELEADLLRLRHSAKMTTSVANLRDSRYICYFELATLCYCIDYLRKQSLIQKVVRMINMFALRCECLRK